MEGLEQLSTMRVAPEKARLLQRATWASMTVALLLAGAKGVIVVMSGSVALLGSFFDSLLDLVASAIIFLGVRAALQPPDAEHRFGHGKAEGLASLAQAAIMGGSALFLFSEAVDHLLHPRSPSHSLAIIAVSAVAIAASVLLIAFQQWVVRRTGSLAIRADRAHYLGDLSLNAAVILSAWLSGRFVLADGLFGLAIALWIAWQAWSVARHAVDMLMDREFDEAARERIFEIAMGNPQVKGVHELKTRSSGTHDFIQLHLEVDPEMSVRRAHLVATEVEAAISEEFPTAEILIHIDPLGVEDHEPVVGPKGSTAVLASPELSG
ncbi:MAG: cation diffusion facilitator family transporter [Alphaproteobacteria bacterium]|nr:MAG: cation diffusion facilitator family transporter [Alphaproteobacteria bacterium]